MSLRIIIRPSERVLAQAAVTLASIAYLLVHTPIHADELAAPEALEQHHKARNDRRAGTITTDELGHHKDRKSLWVAVDGDVWE